MDLQRSDLTLNIKMNNYMKKLLSLIFFFFFTISASSQVVTKIKEKCYLFQNYNNKGFEKKKKVGAGKTILLLRESKDAPNFYVVLYENEQYYTHKANIIPDGIREFEKIKADSIKRIRKIKDSLEIERLEKKALIRQRKADSIAAINRIRDSIAQAEFIKKERELDSIKHIKRIQALAIIKTYSDKKASLVKAGMPIEIEYLYTSDPNSAGGADLIFRVKNIASKTIKYISVTGYPINAVKDKCYCTIRRYSQATRKGIGPIEEGETAEYNWENVWYNHTIDQYIPVSINIQYMNGTSLNITGEKLKKIIKAPLLDKVFEEIFKKYEIDLEEVLQYLNSEP